MPFTLSLPRCALFLSVFMLLSLPARLAADVVWTPEGGWKIVGGVASGLTESDKGKALKLMNKARGLEERKHYFFALRDYKKVTKAYEHSAYAEEAFYHTALIRLAQHKYLKAFTAFQQVITRFPSTHRFNEVIGQQYRIASELLDGARNRTWIGIPGFRNREASIGFYQQILANAPYSEYAPLALMSIARADFVLGSPEESLDALDRMINTYPKSLLTSDAYLRSAQTYAFMVGGPAYDQTSTNEAITYYEDFMILYPNDPKIAVAVKGLADMKTMLADSKIKIGDYYLKYRRNYKGAKVFYNEAITDYPDSAAAEHARQQLIKVNALLAEQEQIASGKIPPPKKKHFLFF